MKRYLCVGNISVCLTWACSLAAVTKDVFESVPSNPPAKVAQTSEKRTCFAADSQTQGMGGTGTTAGAGDESPSSNKLFHVPSSNPSKRRSQGLPPPAAAPSSTADDVVMRNSSQDQENSLSFNSVRDRQMKSLERRSDWFLSAPSGLQTSNLMRISEVNPLKSPAYALPKMHTADAPNHKLAASPASGGDDDDDDSANQHQQQRHEGHAEAGSNKENLQADLADTPPNQFSNPPSGSVEDHSRPNMETRYFMVERYYGSEARAPPSPYLNNNNSEQTKFGS